MPTVLTPKVHLTVVANQGTWEMATTVQVGAAKSFFFSLLSLINYNFLLQKTHTHTHTHTPTKCPGIQAYYVS